MFRSRKIDLFVCMVVVFSCVVLFAGNDSRFKDMQHLDERSFHDAKQGYDYSSFTEYCDEDFEIKPCDNDPPSQPSSEKPAEENVVKEKESKTDAFFDNGRPKTTLVVRPNTSQNNVSTKKPRALTTYPNNSSSCYPYLCDPCNDYPSMNCLCTNPCACCVPVLLSADWRGGNGRGYSEGYEGGEAFIGLYNFAYKSYPFVDVRVNRIDKGRLGLNTGVGFRSFSSNFEEMVGVNVFYDYRRVSGGSLKQIGVGIELLGRCWDLRGNGYIPIGKKQVYLETAYVFFPNDLYAKRKDFKSAMWGLDFEVGKYIFCTSCFNVYAALGPYYYHSILCCPSLLGGQGRLCMEWYKNLTIEFYLTWDRFFHTKAQAGLIYTVPFGCLSDCWRCLFKRVIRNDVIVTKKVSCWDSNF